MLNHGTASVGLPSVRSPLAARVSDYVSLTKPRIIELLLVTTVPSMMLAAHGLPGLGVAIATLVGGSVAAGSANALNCYLDRDIDAIMHRTAGRPLNRSAVTPRKALVFGLILALVSVGLLWVTTDALAAWLAAAAIAFYVVVYTGVLKRRTSQNIVWGGAAGCMPVLIGWAAVSDRLSWTPVVLFAIVFLWTPPHFWALAMRYRDDYLAAGVPMLPVIAPARLVAGRIVAYSWAMVLASLLLWPVAHTELVYPIVAVIAGGWFLTETYALRQRVRSGVPPKSMRLFHASISYLSILFIAAALSALLPG
ncbi:MAG: heme o synthase [Pseudonocardiales bacterium]|jgi:protoheme IX farnesyltransferase|nr:heme o synthase [Pseudonocardiales bacterium]